MYEYSKTYFGGEPCQCFTVTEHEHASIRRHHVVKDFVEKVFFAKIIDCSVFVKVNLEDKSAQT